MKKLVIILFVFSIIFFLLPKLGVTQELNQNDGLKYDYQVIPDEAIRLRILANSDSEKDQDLKRLVRDRVNEEVTEWGKYMTDIDEARKLIETRIPEIEKIVAGVVEEEGAEYGYTVEYGENVAFPTKEYGSYVYPAGEYEAILITIGEGKGANWWCVVFPHLCFVDFSFGTSASAADTQAAQELEEQEEEKEEGPKVKFFLFEWLGWS